MTATVSELNPQSRSRSDRERFGDILVVQRAAYLRDGAPSLTKRRSDLIKQNRANTAAYEAFLHNAEDLVKRVAAKELQAGMPAALHGNREATVVYNNLPRILAARWKRASRVAEAPPDDGERVELALEIDRTIRERAPAGWKGDQAREAQVLNALFPLLNRDRDVTLALFELIKNLPGY